MIWKLDVYTLPIIQNGTTSVYIKVLIHLVVYVIGNIVFDELYNKRPQNIIICDVMCHQISY